MGRIAYVNGRYLPHGQAVVHIEDRGFQFADAVYEYFSVFAGRLADADGHLERLWPSAATASATARSICRSPAARRRATTPFHIPRRRPASSSRPRR
jgi:hypothetical protein